MVTHTASGYGGNAELAAAEVEALIPVPDGLGLPEAAALLDDGATALALVETAGIRPDEWVLVAAAAGGVGSLLVQLARVAGARVIGAVGSTPKRELVRDKLGADVVVDYSSPGWSDRVRAATGGRGPDLVFDGVGGQIGRDAFAITADGGRFSVHGAASGAATVIDSADAHRRGVVVIGLEQLQRFPVGARFRAERMVADAAAGRIRPTIGRTFPLEQAAAAHTAMEAREVLGKALLVT